MCFNHKQNFIGVVGSNSYDLLKMIDHVPCKMSDLYFEDDQPKLWSKLKLKLLLNHGEIASKQCGQLGQVLYALTG